MRTVSLLGVVMIAPVASAADVAINCGGDASSGAGIDFVADRPYSAVTGYGHLGGRAVSHEIVIATGGTSVTPIHVDARQGGSFGYRIDVPNGTYAVTLYFCENDVFGGGFRTFTVSIEGRPVLTDFDPAALVGKEYAIEPRFLATVGDGHLDVDLVASKGEAILNGITVKSVSKHTNPPAPPTGTAHPGYGQTIVRWTRGTQADLAGFLLERVGPGDPVLLTPSPTPLGRFLDTGAPPSVPSTYRLVAVDLWGNHSAAVEVRAPPPLPTGGTSLPIYDLGLPPDELRFLFADAFRDIQARGTFEASGSRHPVGIRHRGVTTRLFGKPSLKVIFKNNDVWNGRDRLNLKAEPASTSLLDERLSSDLYRLAGVPAPRDLPVHLRINGVFAGVYEDEEQVDRAFLVAHGLAEGSSLYKCVDFTLMGSTSFNTFFWKLEQHEGSRQDQEQLWDILQELATVNEGDFDAWLADRFDREEVASFLAATALVGNSFDSSSYYLARDLRDGKIRLVPWDLNNQTFGQSQSDVPPVVDRPVLRNAMQAFGLGFDNWNLLWTRILWAPEARERLARRIEDLSDVLGGSAFMDTMDAAHQEIRQDAVADVLKNGWEDPTSFLHGPDRLRSYIQGRLTFLAAEVPKVRDPRGDLVLSEVMVANATGPVDEKGEHEAWVEIQNRASSRRLVGDLYLSDDLRDRRKWQIPAGVLVPANGYVVVWLDGEPSDGPLHASFRLDPHRGALALSDGATKKTLDALVYGAQIPDVSYGRLANDPLSFAFLASGTPGAANSAATFPVKPIDRVHAHPLFPGPTVTVTLTARVDRLNLVSVLATIDDGLSTELVDLVDDGLHGDGDVDDGTFGAFLPPRTENAVVKYDVKARYASGIILASPLDAPATRHSYTVHSLVPPPLFINEIVARNDQGAIDESGQHEDWVEIWNGGAAPIDMSGMFLSDNPKVPLKWHVPQSTVLAPQGHLIVWLDGEPDGPLHASFRLKSRGDQIVLSHRLDSGAILIDSVALPALGPDVAYARCPDGGGFRATRTPTPGEANGGCLDPAPLR